MKKIYTLFALLLAAYALPAQLIFSESFNYPTGNLQGANGGTGFSSPWSRATTDAAASIGDDATNDRAVVTQGSIVTANSVGNKARICVQASKSTRLDRALAANTLDGADGTVYWLGFWYNSTLADSMTFGTAAQLVLMGAANNATATEMRLGFGKTSNLAGLNRFTVFTRASPAGCAAQNWGQNMEFSSRGRYYVLVKITKGEFSLGTPAALFDGIRVWLLDGPPASEAALASKPNGDLTPLNSTTMLPEPIQTKVLRGDNNSNTTCVRNGVQGIRLRVEGGNNALCAEFDEIRLGTTLASVTSAPVSTKQLAPLSASLTPNPVTEQLYLTVETAARRTDGYVLDALGRVVRTFQFGGSETTLPVAELPKGTYTLWLRSEAKVGAFRFVKQ